MEAEIILEDGSHGFAIVPSGASTGTHEAHELRDENIKYLNKSVLKAVENINNKIFPAVKSISGLEQEKIDAKMIDLDGTSNKSNLGANAILAVSIACCKAAAQSKKIEIYEHISKDKNFSLPYPMLNIINHRCSVGTVFVGVTINIHDNNYLVREYSRSTLILDTKP